MTDAAKLDLPIRPRRVRRTPALRAAVRETQLSAGHLVQPLFVHGDDADTPLDALPGQTRWSLGGLVAQSGRCLGAGVDKVVVFPKIPEAEKTRRGEAAHDPAGLVPRAVAALKAAHPALCVITDVALDPYSSDGHDGVVDAGGEVDNDATVAVLVKQAVAHADAGADVVSPSDMMDGRVAAIRAGLDAAGHDRVAILAYSVKYASAFYGPFREALDSAPRAAPAGRIIPGDKATYQMDPANVREAQREAALDEAEGADLLMVKPAGPYLDVIRAVRERTRLPVAAYQVSGEYLMLEAAAATGHLDRRKAHLEALVGIRRAGADAILTYAATEAAGWL
ncbi:porphobilinogen synthase [Phycisphaera mikurensis]|uniref:Delta-aminolevulinic acid dehydratase n=1 Tax=Phycisphaera mikurensis (strain NBRC 102666 / KCTC 22515 / FYK2301M01) TaxID=1142394 RepID=I0IHM2_PHYMF|nr:porphobilinogen synthase [Phycisphaera mikurensis]MBB6441005.1 porphobilinogen synthase [Phycisphaera mikurensis]BAM04760.1 delta-aminolevulinic acid dehydratase [Phycisphaera mikurensis NBRC 102666]